MPNARCGDEHATGIWTRPGAVVRASWLPADIAAAIADGRTAEAVRRTARRVALRLIGRAAVGAGLIRIDGDAARRRARSTQLRAIVRVRQRRRSLRGSAELKARVDVWGPHGDRQPLFDSLKRAFDPDGVLNAGRGPL